MKALLLLLTATICFAQDEPKKPDGARYLRVDFVIRESEGGRTVSTRNYIMTVQALGKGVIRSGDKVPVTANVKDGSVTYVDVGVNIDWSMDIPVQDQLKMHISADIGSVASDKPGSPLINQTKCVSDIIVPLRKATNVFSADGTTTKRQMQMDVTVTPI